MTMPDNVFADYINEIYEVYKQVGRPDRHLKHLALIVESILAFKNDETDQFRVHVPLNSRFGKALNKRFPAGHPIVRFIEIY